VDEDDGDTTSPVCSLHFHARLVSAQQCHHNPLYHVGPPQERVMLLQHVISTSIVCSTHCVLRIVGISQAGDIQSGHNVHMKSRSSQLMPNTIQAGAWDKIIPFLKTMAK
jgi:hypothetical protein